MFALSLDHLAVTVSDMDRSLRFYCDLLGLKRVADHDLEGETISRMAGKERVRLKVVRLACPRTPGIQIDLQQYVEPKPETSITRLGAVGNTHFCLEVSDIEQAYLALHAKGVRFVSEPVTFNLEHEGCIRCVFLLDPDDYVLELTEYSSGKVQ